MITGFMYIPTFPILGLLNMSQAVPAQITTGVAAFSVAAAIFVLGIRAPRMRGKHVRRAGYIFLITAAGTLVFKLAGLPRFDPYQLEPLAHMVEEIGTMGGLSYLGWYLTRWFVNLRERPRLRYVLGKTWRVYLVCWVSGVALGVAALAGVLPPFPMSGLYVRLPEWSVLYRAIILLPGVVFPILFAFTFFDRARVKGTPATLTARLYLAGAGASLLSFICAEELAWSVLQVYALSPLRNSLAGSYLMVERVLYSAHGCVWLACFAVPYRRGTVGKSAAEHKQFLTLLRKLKQEMVGAHELLPMWHTTLDRVNGTASRLSISSSALLKIQNGICVVAVVLSDRNFGREELDRLVSLQSSLVENPPADSDEQRYLTEDPVAAALQASQSLLMVSLECDLTNEKAWVQVMAAALDSHTDLLPPGTACNLSRRVRKAWHLADY